MNRRKAPAIFLVVGIALVPWTIILAVELPSRKETVHWDVAWAGFDVVLTAAMVATAAAFYWRWAARGSIAAATGALLVADAWFDVVTASTTNERWFAIALAVLVELPLATLCFVLARPDPPG